MTDEPTATDQALDTEEKTEEQEQQDKLKEAINVDVQDIGTLRRKLSIKVPQDFIQDRRSNEFGELKRDAVVPGFRKGHAPMANWSRSGSGPTSTTQLSSAS